jgi:hypothetical protein
MLGCTPTVQNSRKFVPPRTQAAARIGRSLGERVTVVSRSWPSDGVAAVCGATCQRAGEAGPRHQLLGSLTVACPLQLQGELADQDGGVADDGLAVAEVDLVEGEH